MDFAVPSSVFWPIRINMLHYGSDAMQLKGSNVLTELKLHSVTTGFLVKSDFVQTNMWKVNKAPQVASMGAICKKWPPVKSILKTGRGQHITNNCGCLSLLAQLAVQQAV